ncbi:MAG: 2,3-bisphosphoglycerate-independent phosphoglycerate mutase [Paracoccaceae bacterium]
MTEQAEGRDDGVRPVVLCILDGWGLREGGEDNAPHRARTPSFDRIRAERPHASLGACGEDVGLPEGQIGNSEVGHMTIGAGRVVWMDLPRIDRAIEDGSFEANEALGRFVARMRETGGMAHVMGLASPGGVHSHQRHVAASARVLAEAGVPVALHLFTDGRDVGPKTGRDQVARLLADLDGVEGVRVATVMGRFYAMDRDRRWERVRAAWDAIAAGEGMHVADTAEAAIEAAYARGETDEFVEPTTVGADPRGIGAADGVFCVNFRADRAREILGALLDPEFDGDRGAFEPPAAALGMVAYSERLNTLMDVMFPDREIANTLGRVVADAGRTQFRLAETEKYPHVTFFLDGGVETEKPGERRHMAPSPKVRTYDLAPEMSAAEVTERLVEAVRERTDLIVVNYANPDMVGHTGSLEAAIEACEAVDLGLGAALSALAETGGAMLVIADHGNCEVMVDPETGGPHTAHTLNRAPAVLVEEGGARHGLRDGGLSDVAPTLLALMGLAQPAEMTGRSLLTEG